jgi:hypothetical protein
MDCDLSLMALFERFKKAEQFFAREDITTEQKLEHLEALQKLVNEIGEITKDMSINKIRELIK